MKHSVFFGSVLSCLLLFSVVSLNAQPPGSPHGHPGHHGNPHHLNHPHPHPGNWNCSSVHLRFSFDASICLGDPIRVHNLSTHVDPNATYYFDLNSDGTVDASALASDLPRDTSFVIPAAGTYDFTVVVVNPNGCSDTLVSQVVVANCPPDCDDLHLRFAYNHHVCLGEAIHIHNQSTDVDPGATYYFDLNSDGSVDASALASDLPRDTSFVIPAAGTYDFTVVVVNPNGCSDTLLGQVEVENCPPDCDDLKLKFEYDRQACVTEPFEIENESEGVDPGATYYFDLNSDGSVELSALASDLPHDTTIVFPASGTYDITVIVLNPNGCSDTLTKSLIVQDSCFHFGGGHPGPHGCHPGGHGHHGGGHKTSDPTGLSVSSTRSSMVNAYPNPFSNTVTIDLSSDMETTVKAEIYGYEGKLISTLYDGAIEENGVRTISFNAGNLSEGVYFLRVSGQAGEVVVKRLVLMR